MVEKTKNDTVLDIEKDNKVVDTLPEIDNTHSESDDAEMQAEINRLKSLAGM